MFWKKQRNLDISPGERVHLLYFEDETNYAGSIIRSISRDFQQIEEFVFWRIHGDQGQVNLLEPVTGLAYDKGINKIIVSTMNHLYLYCPKTSGCETIPFNKNCGILCMCQKSSGFSELLFVGYGAENSRPNVFITVDLEKRIFQATHIPENIKGFVDTSRGDYFILGEMCFYEVHQNTIRKTGEHGKDEIYLCGKWNERDIILCYKETDVFIVQWGNVAVRHEYPITEIVKTEQNLWVIEKGTRVHIYDVTGTVKNLFQLKKDVKQAGPLQRDGLWLMYSDDSIEQYNARGEVIGSYRSVYELKAYHGE